MKTCILLNALNIYEISRTPMTPPQLSGYTPVLDPFEPSIPVILRLFGRNNQFASPCALYSDMKRCINDRISQTNLDCFLCKRLTIYPPLRLQQWLYDVT